MTGSLASEAPTSVSNSGQELCFRVVGSEHEGRVLRVGAAKCTIGSAPGCTLRLCAPAVGRVHCLVLRGAGGVAIRSWSRHTRLNGRSFIDAALSAGDRLTIGTVELEVLPTGFVEQAPPVAQADDAFNRRAWDALEARVKRAEAQAAKLRHELTQAPVIDAIASEEIVELRTRTQELAQQLSDAKTSLDSDRTAWAVERKELRDQLAAEERRASILHQELEQACCDSQPRSQSLLIEQARQEELCQRASELESQLTHVRSQEQAWNTERNELVTRLAAEQRLAASRHVELDQVRCRLQQQSQTVGVEQGRQEQLRQRTAELETQLAQFECEQQTWIAERKELCDRLAEEVQGTSLLHDELEQSREHETKLAQLESDRAAWNAQRDDLVQRLTAEVRLASSRQDELDQLRTQLQQQSQTIGVEQGRQEELRQRAGELETQLARLESDRQSWIAERKELCDRLADEARTTSALHDELEQIRGQLQQQSQAVELDQAREMQLEQRSAELEAQVAVTQEAQSLANQLQEKVNKQSLSIEELQRQVAEARQAAASANTERRETAREQSVRIEELERQLAEAQRAAALARAERPQTSLDLDTRERQIEEQATLLIAHEERLANDRKAWQSQCERLDAEIAARRAEVESLAASIEQRSNELNQRAQQIGANAERLLHEREQLGLERDAIKREREEFTEEQQAFLRELQEAAREQEEFIQVREQFESQRQHVETNHAQSDQSESSPAAPTPTPAASAPTRRNSDRSSEGAADVIARLSASGLWKKDDAEESTESVASHSVTPPAAHAEPQRTAPVRADDEDDSIEAYMQRLLQRVSGDTETPVKQSPTVVKPVESKPAPLPVEIKPVPMPSAHLEQEPFDPTKYVPRSTAPELNSDLARMRQLAISSARGAIHASSKREHARKAHAKYVLALVSTAATFASGWLSSTYNSTLALYGALASGCAAAFWGYQAFRLWRRTKDAKQANKPAAQSQSVETPAQPEAAVAPPREAAMAESAVAEPVAAETPETQLPIVEFPSAESPVEVPTVAESPAEEPLAVESMIAESLVAEPSVTESAAPTAEPEAITDFPV